MVENTPLDWENRCVQCGTILPEGVRITREFCSRKCYNEHYHSLEKIARLEAKATRPECAHCGKAVAPSRFAHAIYCSVTCNNRARRHPKVCLHCRKEFMARRQDCQYCSQACVDHGVRIKHPPIACEWCSKIIERPHMSRKRFCSHRCSGKAGMDVRLTARGRPPLLSPVRLDALLERVTRAG